MPKEDVFRHKPQAGMSYRRDSIYDVKLNPGVSSVEESTRSNNTTLDIMREQTGCLESEVNPRVFQAKIVLPFNLKRTDYSINSRSPQNLQGLKT